MEFGRVKNFIDGEWVESEAKETWQVRNQEPCPGHRHRGSPYVDGC